MNAAAAPTKRTRRHYAPGRCGDCGWQKNVTRITFWLNGYQMNACKDCIKPYRDRILAPCSCPKCKP